MTVGHVNKFWGRDRGGIEAVLHAQVSDLARRGHAVTVLACRPRGSAPRPFPAGVEGREIEAPVVASMPVVLGFWRDLADWSLPCDLLHFHLPFPLAESAALRIPKRVPWIATVHAEVLGRRGGIGWLQRRVNARFLRRMDVVLVSSHSSSHMGSLAEVEERIRVLPFGFDLEPYLEAGRARAQGRPRRDRPLAVFLGRLVPYKGLDVLLRALARPPAARLRLEVIGEGRERGRLERLARELGVGERVRFRGHLPDADLPGALAAGDVFVLPSRSAAEAFGVAQVEAMAAGLPVVNTALATGTDWVSPNGITGLTVRPDDPAGLARALGRMVEDRNFRLACGRRAARRARELFSLERRGPELDALYREMLGASRAA